MIGNLIFKLLKRLAEWAKAHSLKRVVMPIPPRAGDVMVNGCGHAVKLLEVEEHWVRGEDHNGKRFIRSKRGFLKHYRYNAPAHRPPI